MSTLSYIWLTRARMWTLARLMAGLPYSKLPPRVFTASWQRCCNMAQTHFRNMVIAKTRPSTWLSRTVTLSPLNFFYPCPPVPQTPSSTSRIKKKRHHSPSPSSSQLLHPNTPHTTHRSRSSNSISIKRYTSTWRGWWLRGRARQRGSRRSWWCWRSRRRRGRGKGS